jgi:hypothetical protein
MAGLWELKKMLKVPAPAAPQPDALREGLEAMRKERDIHFEQVQKLAIRANDLELEVTRLRAALTSPKAPVADLWPAEGNQGHSKATGGESNSNSGEKPLDGSAVGLPEASPQEREP